MKHFFLLLLFLNGFLFQARLLAQSNVIDEIIWVIGDEAIFLSDVEKARRDIQMEGGRIQGDPYCILPEEIAIRKLFLHQAKLDSIEVTDSQVLPEVDFYVNNYLRQVGSRERFEEYVNMPLNLYRDYFRESLKERHTIQQVQQKLVGNITVSPTEVRRFYNRIPQDSLPFIPTTVEVEIITQEPVISLDEIDEIRARLRDYTEQVTSGRMQFSTLARMYSDNRETGADGGETGLLGRTSLTPEFAAAAFDLNDPQRISRIVEDEYGFHIIQLIEKRADRINVRHILLRPFVSR
jgi:peptidyl-prolyl cis-trans isomerase SurA